MNEALRNVFDRSVAAVALVLLSPVLLVISILVKATSPGPVLFRQVRVGKDGRPFSICKFRTMTHTGATGSAEVSPLGDPRVTRVGRVLRGWYLDELPQLLNVVRGDMGLVGPRPETPEFVALYSEDERRVLSVRPGLAGPSTLGFMNEAERLAGHADPNAHYRDVLLHERVRLDLSYLEQRSFGYDLRLLCRQVIAIARH
ncbi:sugar transferase [Nocardioides iriomotensis]|uniref:Sugar transferase n=1 Tax=Nocardioides iriomotensis TaxID=715784 RepID=A0A4Q5J2U3_9ACTN|nr:sugar transferase [Nocardioides iriomotensis]RYU12673.1 sugar transferase [Nocardioides iriomotensis]